MLHGSQVTGGWQTTLLNPGGGTTLSQHLIDVCRRRLSVATAPNDTFVVVNIILIFKFISNRIITKCVLILNRILVQKVDKTSISAHTTR